MAHPSATVVITDDMLRAARNALMPKARVCHNKSLGYPDNPGTRDHQIKADVLAFLGGMLKIGPRAKWLNRLLINCVAEEALVAFFGLHRKTPANISRIPELGCLIIDKNGQPHRVRVCGTERTNAFAVELTASQAVNPRHHEVMWIRVDLKRRRAFPLGWMTAAEAQAGGEVTRDEQHANRGNKRVYLMDKTRPPLSLVENLVGRREQSEVTPERVARTLFD